MGRYFCLSTHYHGNAEWDGVILKWKGIVEYKSISKVKERERNRQEAKNGEKGNKQNWRHLKTNERREGEWRAEGSFFFYSDNRIVSQHYGALYIWGFHMYKSILSQMLYNPMLIRFSIRYNLPFFNDPKTKNKIMSFKVSVLFQSILNYFFLH